MCQSQRDGDCDWEQCPQAIDHKPYCPLAKAWEAWADRNLENYR